MFILSTVKPTDAIIGELKDSFRSETFLFYPNIKEAEGDLPKADILITLGEDLTPDLIAKATKLKWVMVVSAGLEKMPFEALKDRNIMVTNARGIHKIPMAEYTFSMILQVAKQTKQLYELEKQKIWDRTLVQTFELGGKTLGILGVGAIGGEIARLGKAFNMKVIGVNRSGNAHQNIDEMYAMEKLDEFLQEADCIVSVLPSTNETTYLLTESHFRSMKSNAIFINVGRGDLVKDSVLVKVMREKQIAHAILDVFETEPLPPTHPFWSMDNVTVTPHISSITKNYMPRAFEIFRENLKVYNNGEGTYINLIDLDRGY
ncbi:D-2-hydroxyacid dehydrogenase [Litchfieldia salsa]|uniref:Phosphoglycerate dehydrogenase n=1 Tax=Litchfieldia salsa TaxID=930152 RepID=A0A1H0WN23_9BACI|nr:D-2-hydroxyacid dehydrogenase [Litchfieldia salsa]SDP92018.1 Phosphoglycerate dehydrogenase [Litchfieldia salsa]